MSQVLQAPVESPQPVEPAIVRPRRSAAIDILRGLIMVLMALDHTRDFYSNAQFNPLDLSKTTPAYFLTRLVTHYCAPTFVFLAGMGAFLYGASGRTRTQLSTFLLTRGIWLIFLEFTLVHLGWAWSFDYRGITCQVIWAIGMSMITLSLLTFCLPTWLIVVVGTLLLAGHNSIELFVPRSAATHQWLTYLQLRTGPLQPIEKLPGLFIAYPFLPWLGIMCLGYGFGFIWLRNPRRRLITFSLGVSAILLFIALRWSGIYGDPRLWKSDQVNVMNKILAFFNCEKYPPSLLYSLMTLGPSLLFLSAVDRAPGLIGKTMTVFGRVPLFFYLLHVPIIHGSALWIARLRGLSPQESRFDLPIVYLATFCVVLVLFPLCYWYGEYKRKHPSLLLSLL
jgi:uncharacterized membrane protein